MSKKGFWRTIESAASVIILVTFLLFIAGQQMSVPEDTDIGREGYEKLKALDGSGNLRAYAVSGDYESVKSSLIMPGYNHTVEICDCRGNCEGEYPDQENVVVSVYVVAGDESFSPSLVKLYMWR